MKLLTKVDPASLDGAKCVGESSEFAVYVLGEETYALVHRHEGTQWEAITISGDGVFRVGELMAQMMRHSYRDMARALSDAKHP